MKHSPVVTFDSVAFAYPPVEDGGTATQVFENLDLELPTGVVSFVGQNGTGKSTALLLSAGRLRPDSGGVTLLGTDTRTIDDETDRNRLCSFIYQNMEFETEDSIEALFNFVYENGFNETIDPGFIPELVGVFELREALGKRLQALSKGEMQRAILVFSLLYGSRSVMMDEPIFALENHQKERALEYLSDFARRTGTPLYYSLHELDLSRKYADTVVLFPVDRTNPRVGPPAELLSRESIEEAYRYPAAMLYQREHLYRERLMKLP